MSPIDKPFVFDRLISVPTPTLIFEYYRNHKLTFYSLCKIGYIFYFNIIKGDITIAIALTHNYSFYTLFYEDFNNNVRYNENDAEQFYSAERVVNVSNPI